MRMPTRIAATPEKPSALMIGPWIALPRWKTGTTAYR
jgi:hypothetical protein